jgi:hypothetical protein
MRNFFTMLRNRDPGQGARLRVAPPRDHVTPHPKAPRGGRNPAWNSGTRLNRLRVSQIAHGSLPREFDLYGTVALAGHFHKERGRIRPRRF